MSQEMESLAVLPRRCRACPKHFVPTRRTQRYCSQECRRRSVRLRKRGLSFPALRKRDQVNLIAVLADCGQAREMGALAPLEGCPYLHARAAVVEAEEQMRTWQARLLSRRKALADTPDPGYQLRRVVLRPGEALETTRLDTHLGAASTVGDLAVVFVGRKMEAEKG